MTGAARLREALEALRPFAGCTTTEDGEPRRDEDWPPMSERIVDWFGWSDFRAAVAAFDAIREALAAVPEAPEPVYEWRAVFPNSDGSYSVQPLAKAPRPGTRMLVEGHNRGWVERRHAVAWERVEEGTER